MLAANAVIIGFVTVSGLEGSYSNVEQERWYRYGSLGFFMAGVVLPGAALFSMRRSGAIAVSSAAWMIATLFGAVWYIMMSGGGA